MRSLKLIIILFFLFLSLPLTYVVWQSYTRLAQEERDQLRYFSETLFDQMEKELAELIEKEENRAVDEYTAVVDQPDKELTTSEISSKYILGYLQNNPDGTFQTPSVAASSNEATLLVNDLREANRIFNTRKLSILPPSPPVVLKERQKEKISQQTRQDSFSERYLAKTPGIASKRYLGKKQQRDC